MKNVDENQPVRSYRWIVSPLPCKRETIMTLLVCFFISLAIWFFNELSKNYTTTISHPVEYVNLPRNKFIINNPPQLLNLKVYGYGFTILRYKLAMSFSPLQLNVSEIIAANVPASNGFYIISAKNISGIISSQLSSEMELLDITPDVFTLAFDSLDTRRVPVVSKIDFSFKPRFGLASPVKFEPSSVTITGPHNLIVKTDSVFTVPKSFKDLDAPLTDQVALIIPNQIFVEPGQVTMSAYIDEFTERNISIPVWVDNQPDNRKVRLFPNEVEVSFKIGLSAYAQIKPEDFSLFVSWEDIQHNNPELKVKVKKSPSGIKNLKIIPENVEYLIEKN